MTKIVIKIINKSIKFIKEWWSFPQKSYEGDFYYKLTRFHKDYSKRKLYWNKYSCRQKFTFFIPLCIGIIFILPGFIIYPFIHSGTSQWIDFLKLIIWSALFLLLCWACAQKIKRLDYKYMLNVYDNSYKIFCENKDFTNVSIEEIREKNFYNLCKEYNIEMTIENFKCMHEYLRCYKDRNTYLPKVIPTLMCILLTSIATVSVETWKPYIMDNWIYIIRIVMVLVGFGIMLSPFISMAERYFWLNNNRQYHVTFEVLERLIINPPLYLEFSKK